ncbi:MAG TPA: histidine kinase [Candidatus Dormibacteraeota bacterium]
MKPLVGAGYHYLGSHGLVFATVATITLIAIAGLAGPPPFKSPPAIALCLLLPFWTGFIRDWRSARLGLAVVAVGLAAAFGSPAPGAVACIAWLGGRLLHDRSRLAGELAITNRELALERQASDRLQVLNERARVARELHDVLGHSLTVVVLQAGAARRMWERDRERSIVALVNIRQVANEGLVELLAALGSLGSSTTDLQPLIEGARRAGLHVDVMFDPATPEVGVTAYRVVQEGLTNALKHSLDRRARVRVGCVDGDLEVEIVNRTRTRPGPEPESRGRGLSGMRERVEGSGGSLQWGRSSSGEFALRARLPA